MVKIEEKTVEVSKNAKNGAKKWKLAHLPDHPESETLFSNRVVPLACKKTGMLEPWEMISVDDLQAIIDEVYPEKQYNVETGNVWFGLVQYCHLLFQSLLLISILDEDAP